MNKLIIALGTLAFAGATWGCSTERHTRTTTSETVEAVPANPVVVEKRTTTQTQIRTSD